MAQIAANGIHLEVERYGPEVADPVLLIRGLGSQLIHWPDNLIAGLVAAGYHVVMFDNRDAGLSQKMEAAPDYTLADMADDTAALIAALGLTAPHVLGMSLGGMIAQVLALRHPDRLRSATIVMSSSRAPGLPQATPEVQDALAAKAADGSREAVIAHELATGRLWQSPAYPFDREDRADLIGRAWDRCYAPDGTERQLRAMQRSTALLEHIEAISAPVLVVHGAEDTLLPPAHGRDIAGRIPGAAWVEIPGMGHDLEGPLPEILLGHVLPFLKTVEASASLPKE